MTEDIKRLDAQEEYIAETRSGSRTPDGEKEYDEEINHETDENKVPISDLRKVRSEAAKYRKRLRQLENEIAEERKKTELSKMEETDKLRTIAEEAEAKAKALKSRADAIAKQAAIIGAASALVDCLISFLRNWDLVTSKPFAHITSCPGPSNGMSI